MNNKALMTVLSMALIFTFLLPFAASASTWAETPDGFDKYIVYSAAGRFDTSVDPKEGDLAMWFHKDVMGRNDMEIAEAKEEATENPCLSALIQELNTGLTLSPVKAYRQKGTSSGMAASWSCYRKPQYYSVDTEESRAR